MSWAPPIPPRPSGWQPTTTSAPQIPGMNQRYSPPQASPSIYYAQPGLPTPQYNFQATQYAYSTAYPPQMQYSEHASPLYSGQHDELQPVPTHQSAVSPMYPASLAPGNKAYQQYQPPSQAKPLWQPAVRDTWQYVLAQRVKIDNSVNQTFVWFVDLFDTTADDVAELHRCGRKVVAYFSAGSYEDWRPDASKFPKADMGAKLDDWAGEKWIRTSSSAVRDVMKARMDLAVRKGFDGVDPDNVDAYDNKNGLKLTQSDAVDYVLFLAREAHVRGLSLGLKNAGDIAPRVVDQMQWSVQEQCIQYDEEDKYMVFIKHGKPVFNVEYPKGDDADDPKQNNNKPAGEKAVRKCQKACQLGFSSIIKNVKLDQWIQTC